MEVPEVVEEEEEIELSLGLSIGGRSFRKCEKSNQVAQKQKPMFYSTTLEPKICEIDSDSRLLETTDSSPPPSCLCSSLSPDEILHREKMRNEILQQMRVQEQQRKKIKGGGKRRKGFVSPNDEEQGSDHQIWVKKLKSDDGGDVSVDENEKRNGEDQKNPNSGFGSSPFPTTMPMQYVPYGDGFGFPAGYHMMMPCWVPPASSAVADDNNIGHDPIPFRPLGPIQVPNAVSDGHLPLETDDSEHIVKKCGGGEATMGSRSGSLGSNSSAAVSDYRSGSQQGGGSCSDTRSHSSQFPTSELPQSNVSAMSNVQVQSELSNPIPILEKPKPIKNNIVYSYTSQSKPSKIDETLPRIAPRPFNNKPLSYTDDASPQQLNRTNVDTIKPPQPKPTSSQVKCTTEETNKGSIETNKGSIPDPYDEEDNHIPKLTEPPAQPSTTQPLPHMPCVSTVGDGPNGKTITGFLYRYTKTEVSIICVCHGSSFTPAEFVKHAGGTDVLHPLKHIVVVPSPVA